MDEALETTLAQLHASSRRLARMPAASRAALLDSIAAAIESRTDELEEIAAAETGLSSPRLRGELVRTTFQLRYFASLIRMPGSDEPVVDDPDPAYPPAPRPDIRRRDVPIGPVLNFAASNFPFAFSVVGGDTASALAAGCAVLVKASPGHPRLSRRVAELARKALAEAGGDESMLQLIDDDASARAALTDPRIKAASFTGSTRVGTLLAALAARRPDPIPFFGELGSVNPAVVTPRAAAEEATELAESLAASIAGSAGQLCTKPGVIFVPAASSLPTDVWASLSGVPEHRLLTPGISDSYVRSVSEMVARSDVRAVGEGRLRIDEEGFAWVTPTLLETDLATFVAAAESVGDEVFGPFALFVRYDDLDEISPVFEQTLVGSLTATLRLAHDEWSPQLQSIAEAMESIAGRVLFDGWPTGVSVTDAMQHGGPWPAATVSSTTSVGAAALRRFTRPVAYQSAPLAYLPATLGGTAAM